MIRALYAIGSLLLLGVLFQLFLRYQYIHTSGIAVMRIDRVSQTSCYMPCLKPTPPPPKPTRTRFDLDAAVSSANEDAIALVKALPSVYSTIAQARPHSKWSARPANPFLDSDSPDRFAEAEGSQNPYLSEATLPRGFHIVTPPPKPTVDAVRLVSYVDAHGFGYYWEVHLDTQRLYFVNDDTALSAKYLK